MVNVLSKGSHLKDEKTVYTFINILKIIGGLFLYLREREHEKLKNYIIVKILKQEENIHDTESVRRLLR